MRKNKRFSKEFKYKVVESVITGIYTKEEARKHYCIGGNSVILDWIRNFELEVTNENTLPSITNFVRMQSNKETEKDLRILELEEKLRLAELKSTLWHQIVVEAEERLNIEIVKKSGAQQLKK